MFYNSHSLAILTLDPLEKVITIRKSINPIGGGKSPVGAKTIKTNDNCPTTLREEHALDDNKKNLLVNDLSLLSISYHSPADGKGKSSSKEPIIVVLTLDR